MIKNVKNACVSPAAQAALQPANRFVAVVKVSDDRQALLKIGASTDAWSFRTRCCSTWQSI